MNDTNERSPGAKTNPRARPAWGLDAPADQGSQGRETKSAASRLSAILAVVSFILYAGSALIKSSPEASLLIFGTYFLGMSDYFTALTQRGMPVQLAMALDMFVPGSTPMLFGWLFGLLAGVIGAVAIRGNKETGLAVFGTTVGILVAAFPFLLMLIY